MSTPKSNDLVATPKQVFALAGRFATEVNSWGLTGEVVQAAKDQKDHPVWEAIRKALDPKPEPATISTVPTLITEAPEAFIPRIQILRERPKPCAKRTIDEQVAGIKDMYRELRWTWTDSGLVIPKRRKGIYRLLVFADTGFTNNGLFDVCGNSFSSWRYADDLDSAVPAKDDQRHPSRGVYAIWVRDDDDPDRDLLGLSANQIKGRNLNTLTVLERQFLEVVYHRETGQHLDKETFTLCSGSRGSDGGVPCACWSVGKFKVYWGYPGYGDPNIGARQVVTL